MDRTLTVAAYLWAGLVIAGNLVGIAGIFLAADSFWAGWDRFSQVYSPFNVANVLLNVALLAPAVLLLAWRESRRRRFGG